MTDHIYEDRELLRQPYPDRQRQAEQGHARLTLPPHQSRHFESETPPRPLAYYEQDVQNYLNGLLLYFHW